MKIVYCAGRPACAVLLLIVFMLSLANCRPRHEASDARPADDMSETISPVDQGLIKQNFALLGFIMEENLRKVSDAIVSGDNAVLRQAFDRNKKGARLQSEIEDRAFEGLSDATLSKDQRRQLVLMTHLARMLVNVGTQTVDLAQLCQKTKWVANSSDALCLKKLLDHVVYMTDNSLVALLNGDRSKCLVAQERKIAAEALYDNFLGETAKPSQTPSLPNRMAQVRLVDQAHAMVDQAAEMNDEISHFLENINP